LTATHRNLLGGLQFRGILELHCQQLLLLLLVLMMMVVLPLLPLLPLLLPLLPLLLLLLLLLKSWHRRVHISSSKHDD
jgi:hypothetical protein